MAKPSWLKKPKYTWTTVFKIAYIIICIILISVFAFLFAKASNGTCPNEHAPAFEIAKISLDSQKQFKTNDIRSMAKILYSYKAMYEYDASATDDFVSLFAITRPSRLPPADSLHDITLYKLLSTDRFSIMASYIPIFNHPNYVDCINAYDPSSKTFRSIVANRSTKDIIIKDILNIGDDSVSDLKSSINAYLKKVNPAFDTTEATMFENILLNSEDEELYNLLDRGFMANNITS
jgi:hypothetical protein